MIRTARIAAPNPAHARRDQSPGAPWPKAGLRLALLAALGAGLATAAALGPTPAFAASVSAGPDRFVVPAGETFDYILTLTDGIGRDPPDVSALNRDFDIVERRRTSHGEMVDGKPVHIDQWVMTLRPKRSGTLPLPGLTVDGLTTPAAQVQVLPAGRRGAELRPEDATALFVRVEAADTPAYVQGDIPVTLRIYDRVGMRGGAMDKPTAEGATFAPDGGQRTYVTTIGKARYRVVEQSYLMTPQKSGTIIIPPLKLQAKLPGFKGSSTGSDLSQILGRDWMGDAGERTETVQSQPVSVTVLPRPEGVSGWFLPARAVSLEQSWSPGPETAKVGDTLTRTIRLKATGASPNQLPPIDPPAVDGLRQYAEDSRSDATLLNGESGAVLTKSFSLVPTAPGPLTLPALSVPWWNTATNRQETAVLPAVTLTVRPAPASAAGVEAPAPAPTPAAAPPQPAAPQETAGARADAVAGLIALMQQHRLAASLLASLAAGLLLLLGWFRLRARSSVAHATGPSGRRRRGLSVLPQSPAQLHAALADACRRNDAPGAHAAYLALARQGALPPTTPDLDAAAGALARALYGGKAGRWDGAALLKALHRAEQVQKRAARGPRGARLAPLYPTPR